MNLEPDLADPDVVGNLVHSMAKALNKSVIPGVTTQSDILSAIFTLLDQFLRVAVKNEDPQDHESNAREFGRVLSNLLLEFGDSGLKN